MAMAQRMRRAPRLPAPVSDDESDGHERHFDEEDVDSDEQSDLEQDSAADDVDDDEADNDDDSDGSGDDDDDDSEEEQLDSAIAQLEQDLAEVPFDELQALRSKIGTKAFAQLRKSMAKERAAMASDKDKEQEKRKHNAPTVQSSKKAVGITRTVVEPARAKARDPRFDQAAGRLNEDLFRKSYAFVRDYREKEVEALRDALQKTKSQERREEIKRTLAWQQSIVDRSKKDEERRRIKGEYRQTERELVRRGKQPFFLKKSAEKTVELVGKYEELKKRGQLDRALEKRAKRNASKDHRYMPYSRRAADE